MKNLGLTLALAVMALATYSCEKKPPAAGGASPKKDEKPAAKALTLAVIPKGTTHVFWKSVERGTKQAGDELGATIIWKGPLVENDRAQQIQLVQQFVSDGVSGIVLAPLDKQALVGPVKGATDKKIPVVIFDSALEGTSGTDFASFVATNNRAAGKMGGDHLVKSLGGKGNVVLLRYLVGSASTDERESGFLDATKDSADIKILSDNQYAGPTPDEAKAKALNMIDQIKEAQGVFCPNESSTFGMLLALRQEKLIGKVKLVGFDSSPPLLEALRAGEIEALVVQNPRRMGYLAVESVVKHLRGEKIEATIDTGAVLVTKANIDSDEVKKILE